MDFRVPPPPLVIDRGKFVCRCVDDYIIDEGDDFRPYVDIAIDTIPLREGDRDYSESPQILRQAADWLKKAADWLERRQNAPLE